MTELAAPNQPREEATVRERCALLSVYDKSGIEHFARALVGGGWRIYASGGTAKTLAAAGIPTTDVADLVGGSAILGHRVVTLSREIHAGLLARPVPEDLAELDELGVPFIDLVCVDLYPLAEEIARPGSTPDSVIEKTDIGGPTMLRSAAKGRRIVISLPEQRAEVLRWLAAGEPDAAEIGRAHV
jgi:phosphoribosylaminoimidazolecarboxamide formyltransferase/IMP cyclohydrolase